MCSLSILPYGCDMISSLCSCHLDSLAVKNSNWNWELKQTQTLSPLWVFCLFLAWFFTKTTKSELKQHLTRQKRRFDQNQRWASLQRQTHKNPFPQFRHYYIKVPSLHRGTTSFRLNIKTYILCGAEETLQIHTIIILQMQDRYVTSPQDLETVFHVHHSIVTFR